MSVSMFYISLGLLAFVLFVAWTVISNRRHSSRLKQLTGDRRGQSDALDLQGHAASHHLREQMYDLISDNLGRRVPIVASDRLVSDLGLETEDVEDIMEAIAEERGWQISTANPIQIPADPTVADLLDLCLELEDENEPPVIVETKKTSYWVPAGIGCLIIFIVMFLIYLGSFFYIFEMSSLAVSQDQYGEMQYIGPRPRCCHCEPNDNNALYHTGTEWCFIVFNPLVRIYNIVFMVN